MIPHRTATVLRPLEVHDDLDPQPLRLLTDTNRSHVAQADEQHAHAQRVRRLWRDGGLHLPVKRRKKRLTGICTHVGVTHPIRTNALWVLSFKFDTTIDADDVVRLLDELELKRELARGFVRIDNVAEFVSRRRGLEPH